MNILSLDTSTNLASVALTSDTRVLATSLFPSDRSLSIRLIPELERLLAMAGLTLDGIDLFAGSVGPGSFTGVRAGLATLQGLALAAGKPCCGFSTLAMLALNFPLACHPVCVMLDARKAEVYGALYDCSSGLPVPLIEECVLPPATFLQRVAGVAADHVIVAGEGALRYGDVVAQQLDSRFVMASLPHHSGHAVNGALLALHSFRNEQTMDPSRLQPVYLRASEAEYAKMKRIQPQQ